MCLFNSVLPVNANAKNRHTLSYRNTVIGILIDCRSFRAIVANAAIQPFYTTNGVSETVICVAATVINSIISPSILSADFSNLERDCRMLIAVCSMFLSQPLEWRRLASCWYYGLSFPFSLTLGWSFCSESYDWSPCCEVSEKAYQVIAWVISHIATSWTATWWWRILNATSFLWRRLERTCSTSMWRLLVVVPCSCYA